MLKISRNDQRPELDTLEACPGFDPDTQRRCVRGCLACHEGPSADIADYVLGANRVLAYFPMLAGTEKLMGLWQPESDNRNDVTVGLYVNRQQFFDAAGHIQPVWAMVSANRSDEAIYVTTLANRADAEAAYRAEIQDCFEEMFCEVDHFWGEPCDCDEADLDARMTRRAGYEQHRMLSARPESLCMCGKRLHDGGRDSFPTFIEHLDAVITDSFAGAER